METYENSGRQPNYSKTPKKKAITVPCVKDITLLGNYRHGEILVIPKPGTSQHDLDKDKALLKKLGIGHIRVVKCKCCDCDLPVQLWVAEGIHTFISHLKGGAGGGGIQGGDYSLNFISKIPLHDWGNSEHEEYEYRGTDPCEKVLIAVLDTGVNRENADYVNPKYLGKDLENETDIKCFSDLKSGWNFVGNNHIVLDDNKGLHGTLVTQFIINQFKNPKKTVEIIPLKTHDQDGEGDLFNIFCAIYYAIAKGAKIINASWGFYYYDTPLLEQLGYILNVLKKYGVLFVTSAGNKDDDEDSRAETIHQMQDPLADPLTTSQLRNLEIHQFLPACFSAPGNNVITVTTAKGEKVAPTENYSQKYVDVGVIADVTDKGDFGFHIPFRLIGGSKPHVFGSSFATAIATGIIGANSPKNLYGSGTINKKDFITALMPTECKDDVALKDFIKDGIYMNKVVGP